MLPETDGRAVQITDWLYDPRGLERYGLENRPYAVGVHMDHPGIQARIEYDGELHPRTVTLSAGEDGPDITARLIRRYPIGAIDEAARSHMAWWWREFDRGRSDAARSGYPIPSEVVNDIDIRRPGRRGRPDLEYAELARDYVSVLHEPKPMEVLAERRHLSTSQLRNLLNEARRRGLLTDAPRGRAGGTLTEEALELLRGATGPPPRWTSEQLEAARLRDEPFLELLHQREQKEITEPEYWRRRDQLEKDTFGDASAYITVNQPQED